MRLYRREGGLAYKPQSLNLQFNRDRRDRDIIARIERIAGGNTSLAFEYRHQRSESGLKVFTPAYSQRLDRLDNSFSAAWNHRSATSLLAFSVRGAREKLEFEQGDNERNHGSA